MTGMHDRGQARRSKDACPELCVPARGNSTGGANIIRAIRILEVCASGVQTARDTCCHDARHEHLSWEQQHRSRGELPTRDLRIRGVARIFMTTPSLRLHQSANMDFGDDLNPGEILVLERLPRARSCFNFLCLGFRVGCIAGKRRIRREFIVESKNAGT